MKKIGVIVPVVLLAVFGLLVMSCEAVYSTADAAMKGAAAKAAAAQKIAEIDVVADMGTAGTYALVLADNHTYGDGYQGKIQDLPLFNNRQIEKGDTLTVGYTFTVSRAFDVPLTFGFVDENPSKEYWGPLTWDGDEGDPDEVAETIGATETVDGIMEFTAIADATGTNKEGNYNTFFFQTDVESVGLGEVTLTFTKLVIIHEKGN